MEKWKSGQKKTVRRRERKVKIEEPLFIPFDECLKEQAVRKRVLLLDKVYKKQIKMILKEFKPESYKERNTVFDTSQWKMSFHLTTLLKQCFQDKPSPQEEQPSQPIPDTS